MLHFRLESHFFAFQECVSSASSQYGSQSGGITDNFIATTFDTFDKKCIFVQFCLEVINDIDNAKIPLGIVILPTDAILHQCTAV